MFLYATELQGSPTSRTTALNVMTPGPRHWIGPGGSIAVALYSV